MYVIICKETPIICCKNVGIYKHINKGNNNIIGIISYTIIRFVIITIFIDRCLHST